ncbi:MAG TPA: ATP-binding cassette domain-containing protein [Thermoanaerobaculia bacterium]|nr:ATP-binding cassette domain-containing protein [Thermoanaerobaculia bacterium]
MERLDDEVNPNTQSTPAAASAPAATAIEVRGLRRTLGGRCVLDGIDLDVRTGETLVILGASGSGKSTLLRTLVGLEPPDGGTVRIWGTDIYAAGDAELARIRQRLGMAFQGGALFGSMTVAENVELPLAELTEVPPQNRRILARIKLGMVGLEDAMDQLPSQLSGGMRKRAALARALALDPEIVFFDEPSAGLDPVTAAGLDHLLVQLKKVFEMTLVVITHEMQSAFTIADRLALMHDGRFLVVDVPEVVRASRDPVVRRFLDRQPPAPTDGGEKFRRFLEELG